MEEEVIWPEGDEIKQEHNPSTTALIVTVLVMERLAKPIRVVLGKEWDGVKYLKQDPTAVLLRILVSEEQETQWKTFRKDDHMNNKWVEGGCVVVGHNAFPMVADARHMTDKTPLEIMAMVMETVGQRTGKAGEVKEVNEQVANPNALHGNRGPKVRRLGRQNKTK